jgi:hypothetical protein
MVLALKMTSAEFEAAMALRPAHAIAMVMCWTNAENAAVTVLPMAHVIVKAMTQRPVTTAMETA